MIQEINRTYLEKQLHFYFILHLLVAIINLSFYTISLLCFNLYFNFPKFISEEIYLLLLLNMIRSILEYFLKLVRIKDIFLYMIGVFEFHIFINYLNNCLTSKQFSQKNKDNNIKYKNQIFFVYIIITFPYDFLIYISKPVKVFIYVLNIIFIIAIFISIQNKISSLLGLLKKIIDNDDYFYINIQKIYMLYSAGFIFAISFYIFKIIQLHSDSFALFQYLCFFSEESFYFVTFFGCFIFFYCLNKNNSNKAENSPENNEEVERNKFSVIDIDIQDDDNSNLSKRRKKKDKKMGYKYNEEKETLK